MLRSPLTRRQFASTLGAGIGATLVEGPFRARRAEAALPASPAADAASGVVLLNSNENPYGPAPSALEAITKSERVAARYPDAAEEQLAQAIARLHGVPSEQ